MSRKAVERITTGLATLACVALVVGGFAACDMLFGGDESDGGGGADFDDTLYYTKTEVDALIASAVTGLETDAAAAYESILPAYDEQLIIGAGFANHTDGWTVPDDAHLGIFYVALQGNGLDFAPANQVFIGASETAREFSSFTAGIDNQQAMVLVYVEPGSNVYAWTDIMGIGAGSEIPVAPFLWIK